MTENEQLFFWQDWQIMKKHGNITMWKHYLNVSVKNSCYDLISNPRINSTVINLIDKINNISVSDW